MASESLLSCISPFLLHLMNQWPWISLRGHPRSSILVPIESSYTYSYIFSGQYQLGPYLAPFPRYGGWNVENRHFPYPTPIPAKIWGCSLWSGSVSLGSAASEMVRLISREIIFAEFQPIWSRYLNVTDRQTRTDGQTTYLENTALRVASRGGPKKAEKTYDKMIT